MWQLSIQRQLRDRRLWVITFFYSFGKENLKMAQIKNKVLLPNIQRNVEDEFPKQRISNFLVTEVEKLQERYGDEQLFVSHSNLKIVLPYSTRKSIPIVFPDLDWLEHGIIRDIKSADWRCLQNCFRVQAKRHSIWRSDLLLGTQWRELLQLPFGDLDFRLRTVFFTALFLSRFTCKSNRIL